VPARSPSTDRRRRPRRYACGRHSRSCVGPCAFFPTYRRLSCLSVFVRRLQERLRLLCPRSCCLYLASRSPSRVGFERTAIGPPTSGQARTWPLRARVLHANIRSQLEPIGTKCRKLPRAAKYLVPPRFLAGWRDSADGMQTELLFTMWHDARFFLLKPNILCDQGADPVSVASRTACSKSRSDRSFSWAPLGSRRFALGRGDGVGAAEQAPTTAPFFPPKIAPRIVVAQRAFPPPISRRFNQFGSRAPIEWKRGGLPSRWEEEAPVRVPHLRAGRLRPPPRPPMRTTPSTCCRRSSG